jgi:hypothetical protein
MTVNNIAQEVASKVATLPLAQQRAVLRLVETMTWEREPSSYLPLAPVTETAERARLLQGLLERMKANPIPADAPRFTREELHERR